VLREVGAAGADRATFVVADSVGGLDSLSLSPAAKVSDEPFTSAQSPGAVPLYLQNPRVTYWFTGVPGTTTTYAQLNAMQSNDDYTLAQFGDSLFRTMAREAHDRLVLDLRLDNGGDNTLDDEIVRRVIRATAIDRPGHFYVVIGRKTFSAAINLTADLERHTAAILVGEPTAAPSNHYGETQRFVLPHSGIVVLYSSLYWQSGDPRDHRSGIMPSIATPLRWNDFRAGRDPALEAILARPIPR
jgi:hypothetical protein